MRKSLAVCDFARALLLTDTPEEVGVAGIEAVGIPPLADQETRSAFLLKDLHRYVDTPYVLIQQWDGFVADPTGWTEEFLDYDYLGAPWQYTDGFNVGDGGFSLRSRRLLQATRDDFVHPCVADDTAIGRVFRRHLETRHGIRIAPEALAIRFAQGQVTSPLPSFGFHGVAHLGRYLNDTELDLWLEQIHPASLATSEWFDLARRLAGEGRKGAARRVCRGVLARHPDATNLAGLLFELAGGADAPHA